MSFRDQAAADIRTLTQDTGEGGQTIVHTSLAGVETTLYASVNIDEHSQDYSEQGLVAIRRLRAFWGTANGEPWPELGEKVTVDDVLYVIVGIVSQGFGGVVVQCENQVHSERSTAWRMTR